MLTKWTVNNFKSIYERTPIELAPLTIFAGANSSGKSTIIQSILLTAQTVQSPVLSKSVVLNGHILRLGAFDDVASNSSGQESISIGFSLSPPKETDVLTRNVQLHSGSFGYYSSAVATQIKAIDLSFDFNAEGNPDESELLQLQPQLCQSRIKLQLVENSEVQDDEFHITRASAPITSRATSLRLSDEQSSALDLDSLQYEVLKPENLRTGRRYARYGTPTTGKAAGAVLSHFLPARLSIVFDSVDEQARGVLDAIINPRDTRHAERNIIAEWESAANTEFRKLLLEILRECAAGVPQDLFSSRYGEAINGFERDFSVKSYLQLVNSFAPSFRRLLTERIAEKTSTLKEAVKGGRKPEYVLAYAPLPPFLDFAVDYVRTYFTSHLKYLGPLRDEPKPVYPLSGATHPRDVGFRGEHTAAVLDVYKHTNVLYIASESFKSPEIEAETKTAKLIDAVADWLNYMGVVDNLKTADKGKLGHELKVATTRQGVLHDLTHVGVGVSQVLPILVLSLLAEPGSTLIFEQPELHLHPRVQTRLAEFFVSMSMLRRQCIVETHSEYLINRLRYLSAISEGKAISDRVILYFVEKEKGHSRYRPIRINEYGVIPEWPKGFFDENEENASATLKAGLDKKRRKSVK